MRESIVRRLAEISQEERRILQGAPVDMSYYSRTGDAVMDSAHLLPGSKLFGIRTHTRFAGFPAAPGLPPRSTAPGIPPDRPVKPAPHGAGFLQNRIYAKQIPSLFFSGRRGKLMVLGEKAARGAVKKSFDIKEVLPQ